MLLPVDLRSWLPDGHLVHFILDAVNAVSLQGFKVNARGTGSAQYPPAMMLSLLIYCIDGTKIAANASKHSAVSHRRAGEMIAELEQEVRELVAMAEAADRAAEAPRLDVPAELVRRQDRLAKLKAAKTEIEARFEVCRKERQAEYEAKRQDRENKRDQGQRVQGREPQPPKRQDRAYEAANLSPRPASRTTKPSTTSRTPKAGS